jgi:hypothetical protein
MEQDRITEERPAPPSRWLAALLVLSVCIAIFGFAYAVGERRHSAQLAAANSQMAATLSQTQSQVDALTAKLNAVSLEASASPSQPTPEEMKPEEAHRPAPSSAAHKARRPRAVENPHWKRIENQLAVQQKAIATTQQDLEKTRTDLEGKLNSTHDELNGSIAKTHDELVALEKKGERSYYEFDLRKSKQFQRVGPLSLALRSASTKHENYDLAMVVDDRPLSRKHVNLYEPVWIYPADSHQPLEVVVNEITKNGVHGYVSAPKYTESETGASTPAGETASVPATSTTSSGDGDSSTTQESLPRRPPEERR